jgi:hypothetical protein
MESPREGPSSTRNYGRRSSAEALDWLTNNNEKEDEDCEWLVIKVPKNSKKEFFWVDYCNGDAEDKFQWLERLHLQEHVTVSDLLERRRGQTRSSRRRQGHSKLRDENKLDDQDPHGKRETEPSLQSSQQSSTTTNTPNEKEENELTNTNEDLTLIP